MEHFVVTIGNKAHYKIVQNLELRKSLERRKGKVYDEFLQKQTYNDSI